MRRSKLGIDLGITFAATLALAPQIGCGSKEEPTEAPPTLVEVANVQVGARGGVVNTPDDKLVVAVPANALTAEVEITVAEAPDVEGAVGLV